MKEAVMPDSCALHAILAWRLSLFVKITTALALAGRGLGAEPTNKLLQKLLTLHCLLQYTRPVNGVSKALCAGSYLSYNGEDSRTDEALHELKRSNVQTVSRLLIAAFD